MKRGFSTVILLLLGLAFGHPVSAADFGQLEETFIPELSSTPANLTGLSAAPSGKYFVWGNFHRIGEARRINLARMNGDDTLDETFDAGLSAVSSISKVAAQTDGKALVCGTLYLADGTVLPKVVRLNTDGSLDDSFQLPENIGLIYSFTLIPETQKIMLNGLLLPADNVATEVLIRLNTDGSIDSSFTSAVKRGPSFGIYPQTENKLLLAGLFSLSADVSSPQPSPLRLNSDGSVDETFANGAISTYSSFYPNTNDEIYTFKSYFTYYPDGGYTNIIQRFLSSGEKDATYSPVIATNLNVWMLLPLGNGKLLVQAKKTDTEEGAPEESVLLRLAHDGTVEFEYEASTSSFNLYRSANVEYPDSSMLVVDASHQQPGSYKRLLRLHNDGEIEPEIGPSFFYFGGPSQLVPTKDGKFYALVSTTYEDSTRSQIKRLLHDGTSDESYYTSLGESNSFDKLKLLENGDLILRATSALDHEASLARLDSTGNVIRQLIVTDFSYGFNRDNWDVYPDGSVVLGTIGAASETDPLIKKYNAEFEEDQNFSTVSGLNRTTFQLLTTPSGKILFQSYSTVSDNPDIIEEKYLPDGQLDSNYQDSTNSLLSQAIRAVDARDRIYTSNSGGTAGSALRNVVPSNDISTPPTDLPIQRFTENGTLDPSFNVTLPPNSFANQLWVQKDGRILASGIFFNADETKISTLLRLLPDGSVDESFVPPDGEVVPISAIAVEADGNILVSGAFDQIGGVDRPGLARLVNIEQPQMKTVTFTESGLSVQLDGNLGRTWLIQSSNDLIHWTTVSTITTGSTTETVGLPVPSAKSEFYRAILAPAAE